MVRKEGGGEGIGGKGESRSEEGRLVRGGGRSDGSKYRGGASWEGRFGKRETTEVTGQGGRRMRTGWGGWRRMEEEYLEDKNKKLRDGVKEE